ncbi:hypothetical protein VCHC41A1_2888, partial [Vibrio cholerae HC-41A1]
MGFASGFFC